MKVDGAGTEFIESLYYYGNSTPQSLTGIEVQWLGRSRHHWSGLLLKFNQAAGLNYKHSTYVGML
jgi:hypothetical protein